MNGRPTLSVAVRTLAFAWVFLALILSRSQGQGNTPGELDSAFDPNADNFISATAIQRDGNIIVGGSFLNIGGTSPSYIARITPSGTVDPSFNANADGPVRCVAILPDGKILVAGEFLNIGGAPQARIARLNANGTTDPTLNVSPNGFVNTIFVQADGNILLGGDFTMIGSTPRNRLARVSPNGPVDGLFNPNVGGAVFSVVQQLDGKVLFGGSFTTVGGNPHPYLARADPLGVIDSSFVPAVGGPNGVSLVELLPDGKIFIAGIFGDVGGESHVSIARLNANGSIDSAYAPVPNALVFGAAVQADGRIIVTGNFNQMNGTSIKSTARLNNDGTLDATFDTKAEPAVYSATLQADGRAIISGTFQAVNGTVRNRVARVSNDNATQRIVSLTTDNLRWLRSGAGPEVIRVTFESSTDGGTSWQPLGSGTRIPGGWNATGLTIPAGLVRATGVARGGGFNNSSSIIEQVSAFPIPMPPTVTTLDAFLVSGTSASLSATVNPNSQGTSGSFLYGTDPALAGAASTSPMPLGASAAVVPLTGSISGLTPSTVYYFRAVATSSAGTTLGDILSFTTLGPTPDPGFDLDPEASIRCTAVQADGSIVIGGNFSTLAGATRNRIARVLPNGTLDPGFDPNANADVYAVVVQSDGRIIIGGFFTMLNGVSYSRVARLSATGVPEPGFGVAIDGTVRAMILQPDGKILLAGDFMNIGGMSQRYIARLNSDGSLDTSFLPQLDFTLNTMTLQPDGKILIGGYFFNVNSDARRYLTRLEADGTNDAGFAVSPGHPSDILQTIVLQPDGKFVIAGNFTDIGGVPRNHVARIGPNGELDTEFDPNVDTTAFNTVVTIALRADGGMVIGGTFTQVGGVVRNHIARIDATGALDPFFNPSPNGGILDTIAKRQDGRLLIGGTFTAVAGITQSFLARIDDGPAPQSIVVPDRATVRWMRGGSQAEIEQARFEYSADGTNFITLGFPTRVPGGWELTGLTLPDAGIIRGIGSASGSVCNGSTSIMAFDFAFDLTLPVVTTDFSMVTGSTLAVAYGTVEPRGLQTIVSFEYAQNPALTGSLMSATTILDAGVVSQDFGIGLFQLAPGATYYYRAVATNASGTTFGAVLSFTTQNNAAEVITDPNNTVFKDAQGVIIVNLGAEFQVDQPTNGFIQVSLDPSFVTIEYQAVLGPVSGSYAVGIGSVGTYLFAPSTVYYYRGVAENLAGTTNGDVLSFVSPGVPPPVVDTTVQVPNEAPGTTFSEFGSPAVDGGRIGGLATITGMDGKRETIIFGGIDGSALVRVGATAENGATFVELGDPTFGGDAFGFAAKTRQPAVLAASASAASTLVMPFPSFVPQLSPATSAARSLILPGLWSQRSTSAPIEQIAVQGGIAPGVTGGRFAKIGGFGLPRNRAGLIYLAKLSRGGTVAKGTENGLWREKPGGGTTIILRDGSPIEITNGSVRKLKRFVFMNSVQGAPDQRRGFAPDGGLAATADFDDGSAGVVRVSTDGTMDIPLDTATPVPNLGGAAFAGFGTPATASGGRFAVLARMVPGQGAVTTSDDEQILAMDADGTLAPVLRRGALLPGTGTARVARLREPLMGEGGLIGLIAALKGKDVSAKNRDAIVIHTSGKSTVAARLGEQAAGVEEGVVYQRFLSVVVTDAPKGRLVFTATLSGRDVTKRNQQGVWSVTPQGAVRLVLRLGERADLGDEHPTVTLLDALNARPANRGQGRSTDASGFVSARVKLSDRRSGLLRIPLP